MNFRKMHINIEGFLLRSDAYYQLFIIFAMMNRKMAILVGLIEKTF